MVATGLVVVGLLALPAAGQELPSLPDLTPTDSPTEPSEPAQPSAPTGPTSPTDPTISVEERFNLTSAGALQNRAPGNWVRRAQTGQPQINEGQADDNWRMDMFTQFAVDMINTITDGANTLTTTLIGSLTSGLTIALPGLMAGLLPGDGELVEPPPTTIDPGEEIEVK